MSLLPDILGEPYLAETIELSEDAEGAVVATLVQRRAEQPTRRAVLYVHGFRDYFFQTDLADFFAGLGFDFYALDLRKYGRSLSPHQTLNFCLDLREYDAELDAAWDRIMDRDEHDEVVVVAHSTGALITALWADRRRAMNRSTPVATVLNSAWLDLQGSMLLRTVGSRAIDQVGLRRPYQVLPHGWSPAYGQSLHRDHYGEWDFDPELKPMRDHPVFAGWLRAVRRGHRKIHSGVDTGGPVLSLMSTRTRWVKEYVPEAATADTVLDVKQIARWSHQLGPVVTIARVPDAVHDVYLSGKESRECAYEYTQRFLAATIGL